MDVNSSVITDELENVLSGEVDVYRQVDENYIDVYNVTRKYVVVLEPQFRSGQAYYLNESYGEKQIKRKLENKLG